MRLSILLLLLSSGANAYEDALSHTDLATVRAPHVCGDDVANCAEWAAADACVENERYMHKSCRLSCGKCSCDKVLDMQPECEGWATSGECEKNAVYMRQQCRRSCSICDERGPRGKDEL